MSAGRAWGRSARGLLYQGQSRHGKGRGTGQIIGGPPHGLRWGGGGGEDWDGVLCRMC